ncbi:MAG: glycosyltransferase family 4 protein [Planctomycetota bacterium]
MTLAALTGGAAAVGFEQRAIGGVPMDDTQPEVRGLRPSELLPIRFGESGDLPFELPGMSDVMPYPTRRFSSLDEREVEQYLAAFRDRIRAAIEDFRPDVVHAHHLWLAASTVKDVAPDVPVVSHCHATGLRQMQLCPQLAERVRAPLARHEAFVVLHDGHRSQLADELGVDPNRIHVVGAGYDAEVFRPVPEVVRDPRRVLYVGKLAAAKGVPQLLDAFEAVRDEHPGAELHLAGGGTGSEADAIRARIDALPHATHHGVVSQAELVRLFSSARVFVLPSFYEGLPLVLMEAAACGCRVVSTGLPGARQLSGALGETLIQVPPPAMAGVDTPQAAAVPTFVAGLATAVTRALSEERSDTPDTSAFSWGGVFERVSSVWSAVAK